MFVIVEGPTVDTVIAIGGFAADLALSGCIWALLRALRHIHSM